MGEQVSKALLNLLNEMKQLDDVSMKLEGALFVRRCNKIINEKVSYLERLLNDESNQYNQKNDEFMKNYIIKTYRQKLEGLYKEYYVQYVNIQDSLQDAKFNQSVVMIKYQKLINDKEKSFKTPEYINYMNTKKVLMQKLNLANNSKEYNEIYQKINELKVPVKDIEKQKQELKEQNEKWQRIINSCNQKFLTCKANFEHQINNEFLISTQLKVVQKESIIDKIKNFFTNIFSGSQKYQEVMENYKNMVEKINDEKITSQMREETISFVEEILTMKENFATAVA